MRNLWFRKNSLIHGGDFVHPSQLVCSAINSLHSFKFAQISPHVSRCAKPSMCQWWIAPTEGFVKVNWDAAVDTHS